MNIIDISWPLYAGVTEYKNKNTFNITPTKSMESHGVRESALTMGLHTGTHLDAPSHFLARGSSTESIPLRPLIGSCIVIDCTDVQEGHAIMRETLDNHADEINPDSFVLIKTRNSMMNPRDPFNPLFVYLDESAAQYLVERGVRGVGIDYLGIERNQPNHETHTILMNADIIILEGIRLAQVKPGAYTLVCLPLALHSVEAAPARAVLLPANQLI